MDNSLSTKAVKSIIYVLTEGEGVLGNGRLVTAQQEALKHHLPFAVIWTAAPQISQVSLTAMQLIEKELGGLNIPLLTIIGNPGDTLPGLIFHTQALVWDGPAQPPSEDAKLSKHPHKWPGVVLNVGQLYDESGRAVVSC
jgi:hypothetical protein